MANTATGPAALEDYTDTTEYGLNVAGWPTLDQQYGWLGTKQRSTDTIGGLTLMGVRLYNPATGRFLTRDPVAGGNDNTYIYPADPINMLDLDGEFSIKKAWRKAKTWTKKKIQSGGICGFAPGYVGAACYGGYAVYFRAKGKMKDAKRMAVNGVINLASGGMGSLAKAGMKRSYKNAYKKSLKARNPKWHLPAKPSKAYRLAMHGRGAAYGFATKSGLNWGCNQSRRCRR